MVVGVHTHFMVSIRVQIWEDFATEESPVFGTELHALSHIYLVCRTIHPPAFDPSGVCLTR